MMHDMRRLKKRQIKTLAVEQRRNRQPVLSFMYLHAAGFCKYGIATAN